MLPVLVALVLFGGWVVYGMIHDPDTPVWIILIPLEPQVSLLLGAFGLAARLSVIVMRRVALRIDSEGIRVEFLRQVGRSWRSQQFVPWRHLATIELARLKPNSPYRLNPRQRHIILRQVGDDPQHDPLKYLVPGLRLDRSRLTAVARRYAPHVSVIDRW